MAGLGRNDPCHCKSGKKYKKCCLEKDKIGWHLKNNPSLLIKAMQEMKKRQQEYVAFQNIYGQGKEIISTEWNGRRVVAVGNAVYLPPADKTKTFHDFLFGYIKNEFGTEWGDNELKKSLKERHPVMQWYDSVCKLQRNNTTPSADGIFSAAMDGPAAAYYSLAYHLYLIRHNSKLKNELINRLRDPKTFQGARHELFVAATFVSAGFEIEFEDESDGSRRHPEFIATHKRTGKKIAVEAKSRHREGVLGQPGILTAPNKVRLRMGRLLNDAFDKKPLHPYVIFLDVNLPPLSKNIADMKWVSEVESSQVFKKKEGNDPYNMIVFINQPYHYGAENQPQPPLEGFRVIAQKPSIEIDKELLEAIWTAIMLSQKIPKDFPSD